MNFSRGKESSGQFPLASPFTTHWLELVTWPHPTQRGLRNATPALACPQGRAEGGVRNAPVAAGFLQSLGFVQAQFIPRHNVALDLGAATR